MRKYGFIIGLLVIVGLLAIPLAAFAQVGASGSGTVTAQGDGSAGLRGEGWVRISGSGVLVIRDRGGDALIEVSGSGTKATRGATTIYRGFNGEAYVSGSSISIALRGTGISLEAAGTGKVGLRGTGTYSFGGESGVWTAGGVNLSLDGS